MGGVPRDEAVQRAHRAFEQILSGLRLDTADDEVSA